MTLPCRSIVGVYLTMAVCRVTKTKTQVGNLTENGFDMESRCEYEREKKERNT